MHVRTTEPWRLLRARASRLPRALIRLHWASRRPPARPAKAADVIAPAWDELLRRGHLTLEQPLPLMGRQHMGACGAGATRPTIASSRTTFMARLPRSACRPPTPVAKPDRLPRIGLSLPHPDGPRTRPTP